MSELTNTTDDERGNIRKSSVELNNVKNCRCSHCRYPVTFVSMILILWIPGIVVAKGFWPTIFCMFIPPYAIYIFIEHMFKYLGFIQ
jgi:hypothetical protein